MVWVKFDPSQVVSLYRDGKSTVQIARTVGGTAAGIRQLLLREKVPLRDLKKSHVGRTKKAFGFIPTKKWLKTEMKKHGGNAKACAAANGIKYGTFVDHLRSFGIARMSYKERVGVGHPRVEIPIDEAITMSKAGSTYEQIADHFKVTVGVVQRRMREAGHSTRPGRKPSAEKRTLTPAKWQLLQLLKKERGPGCEICGETHALDLAHIHANRHGGKLSAINSLLLCPTHHRLFDAGKLTREQFEKIKFRVRLAERTLGFTNSYYGDW